MDDISDNDDYNNSWYGDYNKRYDKMIRYKDLQKQRGNSENDERNNDHRDGHKMFMFHAVVD